MTTKVKSPDAVLYDRFFELQEGAGELFETEWGEAVWAAGAPAWLRLRDEDDKVKNLDFVREFMGIHTPEKIVASFAAAALIKDFWEGLHKRESCEINEMTAYYLPEELRAKYSGSYLNTLRKPQGVKEISLIEQWLKEFHLQTVGCTTTLQNTNAAPPSPPDLYVYLPCPTSPPVAMGAIMHTRRLNLIYVPPEHRRAGHARAIVAALCSKIIARGNAPMLYAYTKNTAACALYEGMGFVKAGRLAELTLAHNTPLRHAYANNAYPAECCK